MDCNTMADISGGEYSLSPIFTRTSPLGASTILKGTIFSSASTSLCFLPINRLMENTVFSGLVMACLFATWPTNLSPVLVKATTEGVVLIPSGLGITLASPASMTATHELVVPKSIPITFGIYLYLLRAIILNAAVPASCRRDIYCRLYPCVIDPEFVTDTLSVTLSR